MNKNKTIFIVVFLLLFVVLAVHIAQYYFLCDDAFISFRYAQNFADGKGLVFNENEKVEGYTNFLWVIILSFFSFIGIAPDKIAAPLNIALSMGLFGAVLYYGRKLFGEYKYDLFILIAPLFLTINRTYAVWSTGGLETRLFSLLVFLSVINFIGALENDTRKMKYSSIFFTLAALTRPEGILLFGCFWGYLLVYQLIKKQSLKPVFLNSLTFLIIIGAHFIFRLAYYGYLFPNTFYAKVTGTWIEQGLLYIFQFLHEYGLYMMILPVIMIVTNNIDKPKNRIFFSITIPTVPYIVYLIAIGGDHFEFRPLDFMLPFLAYFIQEGVRSGYKLLSEKYTKIALPVTLIVLIVFVFMHFMPGWLSHRNFQTEYDSGLTIKTANQNNFPVSIIPGLNSYLKLLDSTHGKIVKEFIGVRQEEHKLAMEQLFYPQAMSLKKAVDKGLINKDESISLWCVGAIPYYSGLEAIDFLGLTDEHVAHSEPMPGVKRLVGHEKRGNWAYLLKRKVVYISTHPSRFFYPREEFFRDDSVMLDKLKPLTYLVPIDNEIFLFKSAFTPEDFKYHFARRGWEFFFVDKNNILYQVGAKSE